MPDFPPEPPPQPPRPPVRPVLQYRNPRDGEIGPPRNSVGKFFLRMLGGLFIGGMAIGLGFVLINVVTPTSGLTSLVLFFLPFLTILTVMIVITIGRKKYGYVTGILLAPVVLIFGLIVLLLAICGGLRP